MREMKRVSILGLALLAAALMSRAPDPVAASADGACPVTNPDEKIHLKPECPGNYGSNGLWVGVQPEIDYRPGGPGYLLRGGALGWKFAWCKQVIGKLSITGKRLDRAAPPLRASINGELIEKGFVPSYIIFPTEGCWEVTGKAGDVSIKFVTRVRNSDKSR